MPVDSSRDVILVWADRRAGHETLLGQIDAAIVSPDDAVLTTARKGLGPGIRRQGTRNRDDETASGSREPWVDANLHLYALGQRLLKFDPPPAERSVPFETLELALVEARMMGSNCILDPEPRYREALLKSDPKALEAWRSLGRTIRWLKQNAGLFGRPSFPAITALIDPASAMSMEIANLLYRRNGSPRLVTAVPTPDPGRLTVLSAAALKTVPPAAYQHAAAGSTVVIDSAVQGRSWKLAKQEPDRSFFAYGKGQIVAYHKPIADPSEFALDLIDLVGYRRRLARIWNAASAICFATQGPEPGEAVFSVINYGTPARQEVQARIHDHIRGHFNKATLLTPESEVATLKIARRGSATEVFIPLNRAAVVRFG